MTTTELVTIILTVVLVIITGIYAWRTFAISKAAKKQADASVKMAEETREQRLNEARPYLLIRLAERIVQWDGIDLDENPLEEFQVTIRNAGKGPAINIKAGLWHPTERIGASPKGYLSPDEEWEATISKLPMSAYVDNFYDDGTVWLPEFRDIVEQDYPGIIAVEYQDIHKRTWVSYLYLQRVTGEEAYVVGVRQSIVQVDKND